MMVMSMKDKIRAFQTYPLNNAIANQFPQFKDTELADVVELVDTLSWGGSAFGRAGSTPAIGTIFLVIQNGRVIEILS